MVREIRIYIEGSGDESEDESTTENIPPTRPGFRSRIPAGKETTAGLRAGFVHLFKELYDFAESKGIKILSIMSGSRRDACDDFLMSNDINTLRVSKSYLLPILQLSYLFVYAHANLQSLIQQSPIFSCSIAHIHRHQGSQITFNISK